MTAKILLVLLTIIPDIFSSFVKIQPFQSSPESPEIWLHSLREVDSFETIPAEKEFRTQPIFQNGFVFKNDSDYVVLDSTAYTVFACRASYPVTWTLIDRPKFSDDVIFTRFETTSSRVSKFSQGQDKPINRAFETLLTVGQSDLNFLSVNLTCKGSGSDGEKSESSSSSIYVFYAGNQLIENAGTTLHIKVPSLIKHTGISDEDYIIFPCKPATPNVTVWFEKQWVLKDGSGNSTKKWSTINYPLNGLTFNPKVGFTVRKDLFGTTNKILGLYRCIAGEEDGTQQDVHFGEQDHDLNLHLGRQIVRLNVTLKPADVISKLEWTRTLKGNASVMYGDERFGKNLPSALAPRWLSEIICCSGGTHEAPMFYWASCHDPFQCKLLKDIASKRESDGWYRFHVQFRKVPSREDCNRGHFRGRNVLLLCQSETVQFVQFLINVFREDATQVGNRSRRRSEFGGMLPMTIFKYAPQDDLTVAEKVFISVNYPVTHDDISENSQYDLYGGLSLGSRGDEYSTDFDFDFIPELEMTLGQKRDQHIAHLLAEYPRDVYYEGETLVVACFGWKMMHATGAHLRILWNNGTRTILDSDQDENNGRFKSVYLSNFFKDTVREELSLINKVGQETLADKTMQGIECWMPQRNGDDWDVGIKNLTILSPILPKLGKGNGGTGIVNVYFGETASRVLEWKIVGGAPEPRVMVTKDGKEILNYRHINFGGNYSAGFFNATVTKQDGQHSNSSLNDEQVITVKIQFGQASYDIQGVYECAAENMAGKVIHTFKVIVTGRGHVVLPIVIFTTIITLISILVWMGVKYWRQQINMRTLRCRRT